MTREQLAELMKSAKPSDPAEGVLRLRSVAQFESVPAVNGQPAADRWCLYSGVPCATVMGRGVNGNQPIYLIVDLATLAAPARLKGFWEHYAYDFAAIGTWTSPSVDPTGLRYGLDVLQLTEADAWAFPYAQRMSVFVRNRFPLEASIGVRPGPQGRLETITEPITLNGRTWDPANFQAPLVALYGGHLDEASACLYGADAHTGAGLSARSTSTSTNPPEDHPMEPKKPTAEERLKALLSAHEAEDRGLIAELFADGKSDAEITAAIHKAQLKRRDDKIAELSKPKPGEKPAAELARRAPGQLPAGGEGGDDNQPADIHAALARHADELKGLPMERRIARMRALYPTLPR